MNNLDAYYTKYSASNSTTTTSSYYCDTGDYTTGGYICPNCGSWVGYGAYHNCYPYYQVGYYTSPSRNKTEEAFKILKKLVEEKIIREPSSFKKFCNLIEKIAEVI